MKLFIIVFFGIGLYGVASGVTQKGQCHLRQGSLLDMVDICREQGSREGCEGSSLGKSCRWYPKAYLCELAESAPTYMRDLCLMQENNRQACLIMEEQGNCQLKSLAPYACFLKKGAPPHMEGLCQMHADRQACRIMEAQGNCSWRQLRWSKL